MESPDYDKVEKSLIESLNKHLYLNGNKEGITALKALNAFDNHYNKVSLAELLSFKTEYPHFSTDTEFYYPDGDVLVSISNIYKYIEGERINVYRQLRFEHHFYGYFEDEVVELRLYMLYQPEDATEKDQQLSYFKNEELLSIQKNEWFKRIKNNKPLDYKIDINFNA